MKEKTPEQLSVTKRKLMGKLMDALKCSRQEALMFLASFAQLAKTNPEYGIQNMDPDHLIAFIKQVYFKEIDKANLNRTLNGPQQDRNNLDNLLANK